MASSTEVGHISPFAGKKIFSVSSLLSLYVQDGRPTESGLSSTRSPCWEGSTVAPVYHPVSGESRPSLSVEGGVRLDACIFRHLTGRGHRPVPSLVDSSLFPEVLPYPQIAACFLWSSLFTLRANLLLVLWC